MLDYFLDFLNKLQPLDTAFSLLNTIFIVITFWVVTFGQRLRIKKVFQSLRDRPGNYPAILIIDLVQNADIRADIEKFRLNHEHLKGIKGNLIIKIQRSKNLTVDDMIPLVEEIRKAKRFFSNEAVDVVHFFYGGPGLVPALVGAEFVNFCRVVLYQKDVKNSTWNNWGPLRHDETY